MHFYCLRSRAHSPEAAREVCRAFGHVIALHQEAGFAYGACMINVVDPHDVLVITRWSNLAAAEHWYRSNGYLQAITQVQSLLVGPPTVEVFEICSE